MRAKRLLWVLLLVEAGRAQSTTGYAFIAPGVEDQGPFEGDPAIKFNTYGIGGGLERILVSGQKGAFGITGGLEGLIPGRGQTANTIGVFSAGGVYHIPLIAERLDFFLGGGYSLLFRDFTANGPNLRVGVNYWLGDHAALRFEVFGERARPPVVPYTHTGPQTYYWEYRLGMTFGQHR